MRIKVSQILVVLLAGFFCQQASALEFSNYTFTWNWDKICGPIVMQNDYAGLKLIGKGKIGARVEFPMHKVSDQPNQISQAYIWKSDNFMHKHYEYGVLPMYCLVFTLPKWSHGRTDQHWWRTAPSNAEQRRYYLDLIKFLVHRYRHIIKVWEVWNEPIWFDFWESDNPHKDFAALLAETYKTIKQIDPEAVVVSGGFVMVDNSEHSYICEDALDEWLSAAKPLGFGFDLWGYHNASLSPEEILPKREVVNKFIKVPSANTEDYVKVGDTDVTDDERGMITSKNVILSRVLLDTQLYCKFPSTAYGKTVYANQWSGLLDASAGATDLYRHYKTLAESLKHTKYEGPVSHNGGKDVHAYRFKKEGENYITLWSRGKKSVQLSGLPAGNITYWNAKKDAVQSLRTDPSGKLNLDITDDVGYLYYDTAGAPAKVALKTTVPSGIGSPEETVLIADGASVLKLKAEIRDANDVLVSSAKNSLNFKIIQGEGEILGNSTVVTDNGVGYLLYRAGKNPGGVTVQATCEGLSPGTLSLNLIAGWKQFESQKAGGDWVKEEATNDNPTPAARVTVQSKKGLRASLAGYQLSRDGKNWLNNDDFNGDTLSKDWQVENHNLTDTSISVSNGALTVNASGKGIWTNLDEYSLVFSKIAGNFECTVKIKSQEESSAFAKAGIMARNSVETKANNGYVALAVTPKNGWQLQSDKNKDGYLDASSKWGETRYPCTLKLVRQGKYFLGYYSIDEMNWTLIEVVELNDAANEQLVGLFVSAHNGTKKSKVEFDEIRLWHLVETGAEDGTAEPLTITAKKLDLGEQSLSDKVRFSVPDMFYNRTISPVYTIKRN